MESADRLVTGLLSKIDLNDQDMAGLMLRSRYAARRAREPERDRDRDRDREREREIEIEIERERERCCAASMQRAHARTSEGAREGSRRERERREREGRL